MPQKEKWDVNMAAQAVAIHHAQADVNPDAAAPVSMPAKDANTPVQDRVLTPAVVLVRAHHLVND